MVLLQHVVKVHPSRIAHVEFVLEESQAVQVEIRMREPARVVAFLVRAAPKQEGRWLPWDDYETGGASDLVTHHVLPIGRWRVVLVLREGPDGASAYVRVSTYVER